MSRIPLGNGNYKITGTHTPVVSLVNYLSNKADYTPVHMTICVGDDSIAKITVNPRLGLNAEGNLKKVVLKLIHNLTPENQELLADKYGTEVQIVPAAKINNMSNMKEAA